MLQCKNWGLRPKLGRVNLYLGTDTNAMLVPIVRDWWQTTDSVDDLIAFVDMDYVESSGLTGNTTSKYLRPNGSDGVAWGTHTAWNNLSMSVYIQSASNESAIEMGYSAGGSGAWYINMSYAGTSYLQMGTTFDSVADANGTGLYVNTRSASNKATLFKNGTAIITDTVAGSGTLSGLPVVHAINTLGAIGSWTSRTLSFYHMGLAWTDDEQTPWYWAVQNVQSAVGRPK